MRRKNISNSDQLTVYLFIATLSVFPFGDVAFREFTSHVMHEPAASLVGYHAVITLPTLLVDAKSLLVITKNLVCLSLSPHSNCDYHGTSNIANSANSLYQLTLQNASGTCLKC